MSASSSPVSWPLPRQRHREVHRYRRFADAALAGRHRDDRLDLAAAAAAASARARDHAQPPARPAGGALCAVSTAVALVIPGWRDSSVSTARRTGSIASACARSVSSATCTRPPRSSIPSIRPAVTMSLPEAGSLIARNASRRASGVGLRRHLACKPSAAGADKQAAVMPPVACDMAKDGRSANAHRGRDRTGTPVCRTVVAQARGGLRAAAPVEVVADSGHRVAADPGAAVPADRSADAPVGPGPLPDLDAVIARIQAYIRSLLGGGADRAGGFTGGRGLALSVLPSSRCGSPAASTACSRTSSVSSCASARSTGSRSLASTGTSLADRACPASRGHAHQSHRDRLSLRRGADGGHRWRAGRTRHAKRKPDADRRREHHRHQPDRVLEDQAESPPTTCSARATRTIW